MLKVLKITASEAQDAMHVYTDDGYVIPFAYFMGRLEEESEQDYIDMLVSGIEAVAGRGFISYTIEEFFSSLFCNPEEGFETIYQITLH